MLTLFPALGLCLPLAAGTLPDPPSVAAANNQFALDLYAQLRASSGNLFFSPYSISKTLAMAYAGARGETAAEMAAVLHLPSDQTRAHREFLTMRNQLNRNLGVHPAVGHPLIIKRGVELALSANLWGQRGYGFDKGFLDLLHESYGAGLQEVDFTAPEPARRAINAWAARQTRDRIPELFAPGVLNVSTRLVLASAIYFKGDWASPFEKDATRPQPFHVHRERKVQVPMMSQTETFGYAEADGMQLLEMPYAGKALAMLVLLPRAADGLDGLEKALTAERLAAWTTRLRPQQVQVLFPRLRMTGGLSLPEVLKTLGMKRAFVPGGADFRGMNGGREPLYLSAVVHKAFVEVNEQGTEAAAATGVAAAWLSMPHAAAVVPVFRADHPFVFAIRDVQTGVILFLGRCVQP
jgi:serpin B